MPEEHTRPEKNDLPAPAQPNVDMGSTLVKNSRAAIHTLTIIGQIEGHVTLPENTKTTKYEHILPLLAALEQSEQIRSAMLRQMDLGTGVGQVEVQLPRSLFYDTVNQQTGLSITDDGDLMEQLVTLAGLRKEYDRVAQAVSSARNTGYGVVMPSVEELELEDPEIVRQGGRYGVRMKASAPSIHMLRADVSTTVSPIVGNEKQSQDMVNYLLQEFEGEPGKLWESNIFGRSFHEIVGEDLQAKLKRMPEDSQKKLREALERILNEGSGGLICIIL